MESEVSGLQGVRKQEGRGLDGGYHRFEGRQAEGPLQQADGHGL